MAGNIQIVTVSELQMEAKVPGPEKSLEQKFRRKSDYGVLPGFLCAGDGWVGKVFFGGYILYSIRAQKISQESIEGS